MLDSQKQDIVLIGGGGHCKSVIDVIVCNTEFKIVGIIDVQEKIGTSILGFPIIGTDEDLPSIVKLYKNFHVSVGHVLSNVNRVRVYNKVKELGGNFPIIKAHDAHISSFSTVKSGSFIGHKAVVNAGAEIGINCIINTGAIIEHDSVIGNHSHISTMATVNADCTVGENSFLSSHVIINRGIHIPSNTIIYSGSVVTKSFKESGIALRGIPAKIVV